MAKAPKTSVTRAREEIVWDLATQGHTLSYIAGQIEDAGLGRMAVQNVCMMKKRIERRFLLELQEDIALHKAQQTAKLEAIYRECMSEWRRSKLPTTERRVKTIGLDEETTVTTKERIGDPALLGRAMEALGAIRKIWGMDAQANDPAIMVMAKGLMNPEAAKAALIAAEAIIDQHKETEDDGGTD